MDEGRKRALRLGFDGGLKLGFHGSRVTSDACLLACRDLDDALGLTEMAEDVLAEGQTGQNTQRAKKALFHQSIFSRLAGYEDTNDAERLCVGSRVSVGDVWSFAMRNSQAASSGRHAIRRGRPGQREAGGIDEPDEQV